MGVLPPHVLYSRPVTRSPWRFSQFFQYSIKQKDRSVDYAWHACNRIYIEATRTINLINFPGKRFFHRAIPHIVRILYFESIRRQHQDLDIWDSEKAITLVWFCAYMCTIAWDSHANKFGWGLFLLLLPGEVKSSSKVGLGWEFDKKLCKMG